MQNNVTIGYYGCLKTWACVLGGNYGFQKFSYVFVVGMFVSFITSLIREKFLKSPKRNKGKSN